MKYLVKLIFELLILLVFVAFTILIHYVINEALSLFSFFLIFLTIYSAYSCFMIIFLRKRKKYILNIIIGIIQFIIISIMLTLIISCYIWFNRDVKLLQVTNLIEYDFGLVFFTMLLKLLFFSFIIVQIINTKKSFFINKYIFIRFFPLKIIFFFFLIFLTPGWEGVCPWNILEDTVYSENFNIYNIDKIKIDMTRTEIIDLIGDPLTKYNFQDKEHWESWTRDGKSKVGDYAWFGLHIQFDDNNKVKKISSEWNYD